MQRRAAHHVLKRDPQASGPAYISGLAQAETDLAGSALTAGVTASTSYTLTCTNTAGSANSSASVNVTSSSFTVSPQNAALTLTQTQQFTASVNPVTWSVDGIAGGNSTVGTISAGGLYTPPATAGAHTVIATNATTPTQTGAAALLPWGATYRPPWLNET